MYNKSSIYALNKQKPDAVVYPSATGKPFQVTCDDFDSEEDFLAFKAWSDVNFRDENFRKEDNCHIVEDKRRVSIDDISDAALAIPTVDKVMEQHLDRVEEQRQASNMIVKLKVKLTKTQFRRLWMYHIDGKTESEIAEIEGVAQQQISKSIKTAEKKINKISPES